VFAFVLDLQVLSNSGIIAIERSGRNIGHQITGILHDGPKMIDHRSGNRLGIGKIVQALMDFEQDHERQFLSRSTGMGTHKSYVGWGIDLAQFFHGGRG
jgi:hypothetical protein